MKKTTIAKLVIGATLASAAFAFVAGVVYELVSIKKLTVDIDPDEEPRAEDLPDCIEE